MFAGRGGCNSQSRRHARSSPRPRSRPPPITPPPSPSLSRHPTPALTGDPSALFRHDVAFALGQRQGPGALPALAKALADAGEHPMVRHEAAEAAGAVGGPAAHALLVAHAADPAPEVAQTCALALRRVEHYEEAQAGAGGAKAAEEEEVKRYLSVDPAPPAPAGTPTPALVAALGDRGALLWDRYRALFALRDRGGPEAVAALVAALRAGRPENGSGGGGEEEEGVAVADAATTASAAAHPPVAETALFKHEVAYVLGQMQEPSSVPALAACLGDGGEHPMVRHEAAEALGAVGGAVAAAALAAGVGDPEPIVAHSCEVALDVLAHEASGAFEYAA